MTVLDIILSICLILSLYHGYKKGIISPIISILSIYIGAKLASIYAPELATWIGKHISELQTSAYIISFIAIIMACFLAGKIVQKIIESILSAILLGWINRILGMILSFFLAILVLGLIIMLAEYINENYHLFEPISRKDSSIYYYIKDISNIFLPTLKQLIIK